jgi:uncharacterized protein (TIGR02266 family)
MKRRTQQRYAIRLPVVIEHDGSQHHGQSRNISIGGLFVETPAPLPFGETVKVSFQIPTIKEPIEVDAEIRWVETEQGVNKGVGVQFRGLRAKHVWALNKLFAGKTPEE